jgi:hypothetical protein
MKIRAFKFDFLHVRLMKRRPVKRLKRSREANRPQIRTEVKNGFPKPTKPRTFFEDNKAQTTAHLESLLSDFFD